MFFFIGDAVFVSATYRLFKIPRSDDSKDVFEATYKGKVSYRLVILNELSNLCMH